MDFWGLGVLIYELSHGKSPFTGNWIGIRSIYRRILVSVKNTLLRQLASLLFFLRGFVPFLCFHVLSLLSLLSWTVFYADRHVARLPNECGFLQAPTPLNPS